VNENPRKNNSKGMKEDKYQIKVPGDLVETAYKSTAKDMLLYEKYGGISSIGRRYIVKHKKSPACCETKKRRKGKST
jgi:hypothetical protein